MAKFIKSAYKAEDWPKDSIIEFCFVGRSNVGKSSLINSLAKSKIAFTSKTPGRTQMANFYEFKKFRLIDLPGYGFSKTGKETSEKIFNVIDTYVRSRTNLFGIFLICDFGVITNDDKDCFKVLEKTFKNAFIILNKVDKYSKNEQTKQLKLVYSFFNIKPCNVFLTSTKKNIGINTVMNKMNELY